MIDLKSNPEIRRIINELYDAYRPLRRGDVIPHEILSKIMGVPPHEHPWQYCLGRLNRRLERERGISLINERTVGYRLATVAEQLDLGPYRQRAAIRLMRRGARSMEAIPERELTPHQRRAREVRTEHARRYAAELETSRRLQELIMHGDRDGARARAHARPPGIEQPQIA